jgi:hypothetical protein
MVAEAAANGKAALSIFFSHYWAWWAPCRQLSFGGRFRTVLPVNNRKICTAQSLQRHDFIIRTWLTGLRQAFLEKLGGNFVPWFECLERKKLADDDRCLTTVDRLNRPLWGSRIPEKRSGGSTLLFCFNHPCMPGRFQDCGVESVESAARRTQALLQGLGVPRRRLGPDSIWRR